MLGKGVGLLELVKMVRDCTLESATDQFMAQSFFHRTFDLPDMHENTAGRVADEVLRLVSEERYRMACKVSRLYEELGAGSREFEEATDTRWVAFQEAVKLVERIDSFLAMMESSGSHVPLARDCRHELDLLCVLVDWCQDVGRVQVAEEAKHLYALACSVYRG
jgi:hypothetical protein